MAAAEVAVEAAAAEVVATEPSALAGLSAGFAVAVAVEAEAEVVVEVATAAAAAAD